MIVDKIVKTTLNITMRTLAFLKETIGELEDLARELSAELVRENVRKEK